MVRHGRQGQDGQGDVKGESKDFGDLIQEDFQDSYRNLTLKTVMGLKWSAIFCPQAKFVMKTDDDIFINVPLLHSAIKNTDFIGITGKNDVSPYERETFIFYALHIIGCIKNGPQSAFQPLADPDNPMDPAQLPPAHPAFVAGAGYVISGQLVQDLYLASLETRLFPVEDVFTTAHVARRIGVHPPIHDTR